MPADEPYPLLRAIDAPADLRRLERAQLPALAEELRRYLIETVSQKGGHFAAGLGAVELAVALHYVYDTPQDRLSGMWAIKLIRTRCLPAGASDWARSSSRVVWRPFRRATRARTTRSGLGTRAPRSAPRSAWRLPRLKRATRDVWSR